jgi:spore coat polysaccharide biosynthesis predicted glycosyltransferase SpsG
MDGKRGPILFRCDGTRALSWEPLYQCLSLAAALQRRRRGTHFFSYLDPLSLAHTINRGNNDWVPAEQPIGVPGDLRATLAQVRKLNAATVVLAGSAANADYIAEIKATGAYVIALDSQAKFVNAADLVVNPFVAPHRKHFKVAIGSQLLVGRKYALVRGIFRRQRTIRAQEQPAPFRAMVAFGDDDPADQTLVRTEQLLQCEKVAKVSILAHEHHARFHEIEDFCAASGGKVEVITEVKELMTRLVRSHFVVTGGDSTALEMCCTGLPQLIISDTPHHAANGKQMESEGMATYLGDASKVRVEQLSEAVDILLDDPMERLSMSRCARNLVDGRGGDRVVNGMEIMLHAPQRMTRTTAAAA